MPFWCPLQPFALCAFVLLHSLRSIITNAAACLEAKSLARNEIAI
jgi:hypothetical protein